MRCEGENEAHFSAKINRNLFKYMQNYFAYGEMRSEEENEAHFSARINTNLFNYMQIFTVQFWRKYFKFRSLDGSFKID